MNDLLQSLQTDLGRTFLTGLILGPMAMWILRGTGRFVYNKWTGNDKPMSTLAGEIIRDLQAGGRNGTPWKVQGFHLITNGISIQPTKEIAGPKSIVVNGRKVNSFLSAREEKLIYKLAKEKMDMLDQESAKRDLASAMDFLNRR